LDGGIKMSKKEIKANSSLEQSMIAAVRNEDFENSGMEDTKENRDSFRILKAEVQRLVKQGYDTDIPF